MTSRKIPWLVSCLLAVAPFADARTAAAPLQGWTRVTEYAGEITVKGYKDSRNNCPRGCAAECKTDASGTYLSCSYNEGKGTEGFKRPHCTFGGLGKITCENPAASGRSARFEGYEK